MAMYNLTVRSKLPNDDRALDKLQTRMENKGVRIVEQMGVLVQGVPGVKMLLIVPPGEKLDVSKDMLISVSSVTGR